MSTKINMFSAIYESDSEDDCNSINLVNKKGKWADEADEADSSISPSDGKEESSNSFSTTKRLRRTKRNNIKYGTYIVSDVSRFIGKYGANIRHLINGMNVETGVYGWKLTVDRNGILHFEAARSGKIEQIMKCRSMIEEAIEALSHPIFNDSASEASVETVAAPKKERKNFKKSLKKSGNKMGVQKENVKKVMKVTFNFQKSDFPPLRKKEISTR